MRAILPILFLGPFLMVSSCSSEDPPERELPSPQAVRDFYGLSNGNCWRYRFSSGGATLYAGTTVKGPDDIRVAGHPVYIWSFVLDSGGNPKEWLLDTESNGEIRLRRSVLGQGNDRLTYRYEKDPIPLFVSLVMDTDKTPLLKVGERFETDSAPIECPTGGNCADGELEQHTWSVLSDSEQVATPLGEKTAFSLEYRRRSETARFSLVEGFGFAKFTAFDGTFYQVCAARVCDSTGNNCQGANSCNELDCN